MNFPPGPPPPLRLAQLGGSHPIAAFTSGDAAIDSFLHDQALAEQGIGLSNTTVALGSVGGEVLGFFTMSPLSIRIDPRILSALELDAKSIAYPSVGGYLLGRLGTSTQCQRQGVGASLVSIAVEHARKARQHTGGVFVAVDAKAEELMQWYAKLGFRRIGESSRRMVLKL